MSQSSLPLWTDMFNLEKIQNKILENTCTIRSTQADISKHYIKYILRWSSYYYIIMLTNDWAAQTQAPLRLYLMTPDTSRAWMLHRSSWRVIAIQSARPLLPEPHRDDQLAFIELVRKPQNTKCDKWWTALWTSAMRRRIVAMLAC